MSIITPTITVIGDDNSRASRFRWENIDMEIDWLPNLFLTYGRNIHHLLASSLIARAATEAISMQ